MSAYLLGAVVFLAAIVVFVMQNDTSVIIHFINWTSPELSLALVALIAACAGAVATFLVDSFRAFKTGQKIKTLVNKNKKYQKEIQSLKSEIAGLKGKKSSSITDKSTEQSELDN